MILLLFFAIGLICGSCLVYVFMRPSKFYDIFNIIKSAEDKIKSAKNPN